VFKLEMNCCEMIPKSVILYRKIIGPICNGGLLPAVNGSAAKLALRCIEHEADKPNIADK